MEIKDQGKEEKKSYRNYKIQWLPYLKSDFNSSMREKNSNN